MYWGILTFEGCWESHFLENVLGNLDFLGGWEGHFLGDVLGDFALLDHFWTTFGPLWTPFGPFLDH